MTITLTLPYPDSALSQNSRSMWKKINATTAYREDVLLTTKHQARGVCFQKATATVTFVVPDPNRRRDALNTFGMLKPAFDGIVDAGLIPDDDWKHLRVLPAEELFIKGKWAVVIVLEETS